MGAEYECKNELGRRLVRVRMSGLFDEKTMLEWCAFYRERGTSPYRGKKHMVLADMRGMKTVHPSIAALMGEEIGYARQHGVVLCVHLTDDTMQRLQAARVARQFSPHDDVTVDVASAEEAEQIVADYLDRIDDPGFSGSFRTAGSTRNEPASSR